jgi:hypothetical protein
MMEQKQQLRLVFSPSNSLKFIIGATSLVQAQEVIKMTLITVHMIIFMVAVTDTRGQL